MTREEQRAYDSARYYANKTPEFKERRRVASARHYQKLRDTDPEELKRRTHAKNLNYRPKIFNDPERHAESLKSKKEAYTKRQQVERYSFGQRLKQWLFLHAWVRDELPWKSHRPVLHDQSTEHYCAGCKWAKFGGRRLWFKSLIDESYLCQSCYIPPNPDWNKIMPEGYEDVRHFKDLRARKEQLDGSGAPPF